MSYVFSKYSNGNGETTGDSLWFNITKDGTSNGEPIFEFLNECFFMPTAIRDTGDGDKIPIVHIRGIENNRRILVHIQRSNTGGVLLGGFYRGLVANDLACVVQLRIAGIRNGS